MDLLVTAGRLTAIEVSPPMPSVAVGYGVPFTATGTYTDLTTRDLTTAVAWTSTNEAVAIVDGVLSGQQQIRGVGVGTTVIAATDPATGIVGMTTLTVTAAVLVSIAVTPALPSIALGYTQQFAATGTFSDNSTQDLTTAVTWSSGTLTTATISNAGGTEGLATSVATGTTTITATHAATSIAGSTTLTVTAAVLVSIAVTPALPSIALGYTQQFAATGTFSDNSTQDLTTAVTWSSGTLATATISNAGGSEGLATSVATGTTTIAATHAATSIAGSTTLTVTAAIVFRAASSASAGASTTTLTVPTPSGTAAGEVMVAGIAVRPSTATITPPSGWTLVQRVDNTTPNTSSLAFYTRVAVVGEPTSHDWTFSSSNGSAAGILTFQGVDTGQIIDVSGGQATASSLSHTAPSVTATVAETMLVTLHAFTSSSDWTPPTGMTEAVDIASGTVHSAAGISLCAAFLGLSGAGATGDRSAVAGANADTGNAVSLALRP